MSGSTPADGIDGPRALPLVSRRGALGIAYAAGLAALTGCGLRLDLPQPPPPVPTRRLVPDERLLVSLVRKLEALVDHADAVIAVRRGGKPVTTVRAVLAKQATVLRGRLTNDGVPTSVIDATPSVAATSASPTSSSGSASGSSPTASGDAVATPTPTVPALATALAGVTPAEWAGLASASAANRPLALSAQSARMAGGLLLGATAPFSPTPSSVRTTLVEHTAPLVYGFEVVAAQSIEGARKRALRALDEALELQRALGGSTDPAPGGWALPFAVTTPKEASRLAEHLFATSIGATTTLASAAKDAPSAEDIARWSARVQAIAARWGVPLTAFPGTES